MGSLQAWLHLALGLAASAVLPSLLYLALRRSPVRRPGPRLAAWACLWAGQLLLPLVLVAWLSLEVGHDMARRGSLPAAVVFGGGGAAVAAWLTARASYLLVTGASILHGADAQAVALRCERAAKGASVGLVGTMALGGLMLVLPIPGRFGALIYVFAILGPIGGASLLMVLGALTARALLRR